MQDALGELRTCIDNYSDTALGFDKFLELVVRFLEGDARGFSAESLAPSLRAVVEIICAHLSFLSSLFEADSQTVPAVPSTTPLLIELLPYFFDFNRNGSDNNIFSLSIINIAESNAEKAPDFPDIIDCSLLPTIPPWPSSFGVLRLVAWRSFVGHDVKTILTYSHLFQSSTFLSYLVQLGPSYASGFYTFAHFLLDSIPSTAISNGSPLIRSSEQLLASLTRLVYLVPFSPAGALPDWQAMTRLNSDYGGLVGIADMIASFHAKRTTHFGAGVALMLTASALLSSCNCLLDDRSSDSRNTAIRVLSGAVSSMRAFWARHPASQQCGHSGDITESIPSPASDIITAAPCFLAASAVLLASILGINTAVEHSAAICSMVTGRVTCCDCYTSTMSLTAGLPLPSSLKKSIKSDIRQRCNIEVEGIADELERPLQCTPNPPSMITHSPLNRPVYAVSHAIISGDISELEQAEYPTRLLAPVVQRIIELRIPNVYISQIASRVVLGGVRLLTLPVAAGLVTFFTGSACPPDVSSGIVWALIDQIISEGKLSQHVVERLAEHSLHHQRFPSPEFSRCYPRMEPHSRALLWFTMLMDATSCAELERVVTAATDLMGASFVSCKSAMSDRLRFSGETLGPDAASIALGFGLICGLPRALLATSCVSCSVWTEIIQLTGFGLRRPDSFASVKRFGGISISLCQSVSTLLSGLTRILPQLSLVCLMALTSFVQTASNTDSALSAHVRAVKSCIASLIASATSSVASAFTASSLTLILEAASHPMCIVPTQCGPLQQSGRTASVVSGALLHISDSTHGTPFRLAYDVTTPSPTQVLYDLFSFMGQNGLSFCAQMLQERALIPAQQVLLSVFCLNIIYRQLKCYPHDDSQALVKVLSGMKPVRRKLLGILLDALENPDSDWISSSESVAVLSHLAASLSPSSLNGAVFSRCVQAMERIRPRLKTELDLTLAHTGYLVDTLSRGWAAHSFLPSDILLLCAEEDGVRCSRGLSRLMGVDAYQNVLAVFDNAPRNSRGFPIPGVAVKTSDNRAIPLRPYNSVLASVLYPETPATALAVLSCIHESRSLPQRPGVISATCRTFLKSLHELLSAVIVPEALYDSPSVSFICNGSLSARTAALHQYAAVARLARTILLSGLPQVASCETACRLRQELSPGLAAEITRALNSHVLRPQQEPSLSGDGSSLMCESDDANSRRSPWLREMSWLNFRQCIEISRELASVIASVLAGSQDENVIVYFNDGITSIPMDTLRSYFRLTTVLTVLSAVSRPVPDNIAQGASHLFISLFEALDQLTEIERRRAWADPTECAQSAPIPGGLFTFSSANICAEAEFLSRVVALIVNPPAPVFVYIMKHLLEQIDQSDAHPGAATSCVLAVALRTAPSLIPPDKTVSLLDSAIADIFTPSVSGLYLASAVAGSVPSDRAQAICHGLSALLYLIPALQLDSDYSFNEERAPSPDKHRRGVEARCFQCTPPPVAVASPGHLSVEQLGRDISRFLVFPHDQQVAIQLVWASQSIRQAAAQLFASVAVAAQSRVPCCIISEISRVRTQLRAGDALTQSVPRSPILGITPNYDDIGTDSLDDVNDAQQLSPVIFEAHSVNRVLLAVAGDSSRDEFAQCRTPLTPATPHPGWAPQLMRWRYTYSQSPGLRNDGCLCYLCSMLQLLFTMVPLRNAILATLGHGELRGLPRYNDSIAVLHQVQRLFVDMQRSTRPVVSPVALLSVMRVCGEQLHVRKQFDSFLILTHVLDRIEDALRAIGGPQQTAVEDTLRADFLTEYRGTGEDEYRCTHIHYGRESSLLHVLEVQSAHTLDEALKLTYFLQSRMEYRCKACDAMTECVRNSYFLVEALPPVLCFQLRRYGQDCFGFDCKYEHEIDVPLDLDMAPYCADLSGEREAPSFTSSDSALLRRGEALSLKTTNSMTTYTLRAAVCHCGDLDQGHYIALVRLGSLPNAPWARYDDDTVTRIDCVTALDEISGRTKLPQAYFLTYERTDACPRTLFVPSFASKLQPQTHDWRVACYPAPALYQHMLQPHIARNLLTWDLASLSHDDSGVLAVTVYARQLPHEFWNKNRCHCSASDERGPECMDCPGHAAAALVAHLAAIVSNCHSGRTITANYLPKEAYEALAHCESASSRLLDLLGALQPLSAALRRQRFRESSSDLSVEAHEFSTSYAPPADSSSESMENETTDDTIPVPTPSTHSSTAEQHVDSAIKEIPAIYGAITCPYDPIRSIVSRSLAAAVRGIMTLDLSSAAIVWTNLLCASSFDPHAGAMYEALALAASAESTALRGLPHSAFVVELLQAGALEVIGNLLLGKSAPMTTTYTGVLQNYPHAPPYTPVSKAPPKTTHLQPLFIELVENTLKVRVRPTTERLLLDENFWILIHHRHRSLHRKCRKMILDIDSPVTSLGSGLYQLFSRQKTTQRRRLQIRILLTVFSCLIIGALSVLIAFFFKHYHEEQRRIALGLLGQDRIDGYMVGGLCHPDVSLHLPGNIDTSARRPFLEEFVDRRVVDLFRLRPRCQLPGRLFHSTFPYWRTTDRILTNMSYFNFLYRYYRDTYTVSRVIGSIAYVNQHRDVALGWPQHGWRC